MSILSRLPTLPPKDDRHAPANPFSLLRRVTFLQYMFFLSGWWAWVCDAIDFFAVTLGTTRLATFFNRPVGEITLSITLTLLFRPLGALIFGLLGDRYGRKWPLIANLVIIASFSLGSGLINDFQTFLAMRSIFGIAMGGVWGIATALCLENLPIECRGLFSGFLQLGYPVGYLILAAVNLQPRIAQPDGWRILFYFGAGCTCLAIILRLVLPESTAFAKQKAALAADGPMPREKNVVFLKELGKMLKSQWLRCLFGVLLMTGMNFYSHGSQDLFPTYIQRDKGLSQSNASIITIIGNCGAITGCMIGGYVSQYLGRRLTIIANCVFCCAMIPLWLLPNSFGGLAAGAFFVQAGVQGAYGVIPVYLSEISPPAFRAVWPGVAYQLGNMISSASAQIEAVGGENLKDPITGIPAYGKVSAILIACSAITIILCCLIGVESHSAKFEQGAAAFAEGAGKVSPDDLKEKVHMAEVRDLTAENKLEHEHVERKV